MAEITDRDWRVWGYVCRYSPSGKLGYNLPRYNRAVPDGYPEHGDREDIGRPTEAEEARAEAIEQAVRTLEREDWRPAWALRVRYRAAHYIGEESEEARKLRWTLDELFDYVEVGRRIVSARIESAPVEDA